MTADTHAHWFSATVVFMAKDGLSSQTIRVINRPQRMDGMSYSGGTSGYWPLIKDIRGVSSKMADVLPAQAQGSIVLNNAPGSFGYERKISDLLERYTPIGQELRIYYDRAALTADAVTPSTSIFRGRVRSARIDPDNGDLVLDFQTPGLAPNPTSRTIKPEDWPDALPAAYGQPVQMPVGRSGGLAAETKCYCIDTINYVYSFAASPNGIGGGYYYAKNAAGDYGLVGSTSNVSTAQWSDGGSDSSHLAIYESKRAHWLGFQQGYNNSVITRVVLRGHGKTDATYAITGDLKVEIWEGLNGDDTISPQRQVGQGSIDINAYEASFQGSANFDIPIALEAPAVLNSDNGYWLVVSTPDVDFSTSGFPVPVEPSLVNTASYHASSKTVWYTSGNDWKSTTGLTSIFRFSFYGVKFTDTSYGETPEPETGLQLLYTTLTQNGAATADLSKLDLVRFSYEQLDNGSGTITGVVDDVIAGVEHVCRLFSSQSGWGSAIYLDTSYFQTHNAAAHLGKTSFMPTGSPSGRQLQSDVLRGILQESCARVAPLDSDGSDPGTAYYGTLWIWGGRMATSAIITDEDADIRGIDIRGLESVVNAVQLYYNKTMTSNLPIVTGAGAVSGYAKAITAGSGDDPRWQNLVESSAAIFGNRPARVVNSNWIKDDEDAEALVEFLLSVYSHPHMYVEMDLPFWKFQALNCLDVIEILHPDLPAHFGTSTNAHLPTYDSANYGSSSVDWNESQYPKRAERYRAQIEAKELIYSRTSAPKLRLSARLLINPNDPT